jgi:hypothetical protein
MSVRLTACGWLILWCGFTPCLSRGVERERPSEPIDLFAALEAKQIEVTVIPDNARKLTIQVANKRDVPLTLRLPEAIAAVPVLAQRGLPRAPGQIGGPGQLFGNGWNGGGANQATQGLGAPWGQNGQNMFAGNGFPGGLMNVSPGKVIKQRLPCVCLDFGKPDPRPQIAYRLQRLEDYQDAPGLRELLVAFGQGGHSQQVVQLAAWHLANGLSWEQLAQVPHLSANGHRQPRFSAAELELARQLVKQVAPRQQPAPARPASQSLSSR